MIRSLARTSAVELRLFLREPVTAVFTLALPLVLLFVLGGVFGNDPNPGVYRGVGAMNYYVPAYIALVLAAMGLITLPAHLAAYRERGVLRRFRASSIPRWSVLGAHAVVTTVVAFVGSVLLVLVAALTQDIAAPQAVLPVLGAFLLGAGAFVAIGMLLGTVLPTARAAQGAGILLWFVMMILGGAGPPPEVLPDGMRTLGDLLPISPVITLLQDPWLGFGWNVGATITTVAITVVAAAATWRLLRWT